MTPVASKNGSSPIVDTANWALECMMCTAGIWSKQTMFSQDWTISKQT